MLRTGTAAVWIAVCLGTAIAQEAVDPRNMHERIIAIVPIVGAGTYQDPRRPLFAPDAKAERNPKGIHAYRWEPSDDGKYAIVEFVALDRAALEPILKDARVVRAFEKGKDVKPEEIERVLSNYRKDRPFLDGFTRRPE